ncbi:MAG: hypothetical protein QXH03_11320 [Candidatus Bathyarchaeia archaeon]
MREIASLRLQRTLLGCLLEGVAQVYQFVRLTTAWAHPVRFPKRLLMLMMFLNMPKLVLVILAPNHIAHPQMTFDTWFYWDEYHIIKALDEDHSLKTVLSWFHGNWVEKTPNPYYRPLTSVSLWLDYLIWRHNHRGYLLTSWTLQCLTGWLLTTLVTHVVGNAICGILTGVAFAWIWLPSLRTIVHHMSTRTDGLCAFWMLLSLVWAMRWIESAQVKWGIASWISALAALLSKEMALALPFLIAFCGFFKTGRKSWQRTMLLYTAIIILVFLWGMAYRFFLPEAISAHWQRFIKPSRIFWQYTMVLSATLPWAAQFIWGVLIVFSPWILFSLQTWWLIVKFAIGVVGIICVLKIIPRTFLFFIGWVLLSWIPLLPVRLIAPHYSYIPNLATYTLYGAMILALAELAWQRKQICENKSLGLAH